MTRLLVILFIFSCTGWSQGNALKHFNLRDGLPSNAIRVFYKDSRGYLWVGTDAGVSRFDGQNFVNYNSKDGLANESIWSITEDAEGRMWFGSYGAGVTIFDGTEFTTITKEDSLHTVGIRVLEYLPESNIVMAGCQDGCIRFNMDGSFSEFYASKEGVDRAMLFGGLYQFHSDTVLFSGMNAQNYFYLTKQDSVIPVPREHFLEKASAHSSTSREGTYICGSNSIKLFGPDSSYSIQYTDYGLRGPAWDIVKDDRGNIWSATWGGGSVNQFGLLIKCDDEGCYDYAAKLGIESEVFWSLYYDEENEQLYIGTLDQGMFVFTYSPFENVPLFKGRSKEQFSYHQSANGQELMIGEKEVHELISDSLGQDIFDDCLLDQLAIKLEKWALDTWSVSENQEGSYDYYQEQIRQGKWEIKNPYLDQLGVRLPDGSLYEPNKKRDKEQMRQSLQHLEAQIYRTFNILDAFTYDGVDWYSTTHGFVKVNGPCDFEFFKIINGPVHLDSTGRVWVFQQYQPVTMVPNLNEPTIHYKLDLRRVVAPHDVTSVVENSKNELLFASWYGGLYQYKGDTTFINYTTENSFLTTDRAKGAEYLKDDQIAILLSNGDLMLAKFLDTLSFIKTLNVESGLHGSTFFDVQLHRDFLFVFHEQGIDYAPYDDVLNNDEVSFTLIDEHEGYPIFEGSIVKRAEDYWLVHTQGYVKIDLDQLLKFNKTSTHLSITDLKVHFESRDWAEVYELEKWDKIPKELSFDYHENSIEILFDVVNLKNYGKDEFRYRLLGLSDEWTPWRNERKATFAGLEPGEYEFVVQSRNQLNLELVNENGLKFTIHPPWWQTTWFRILAISFVLFVLFLFFRWRTAKLRQRQVELEEKIDDATLEIRHQKDEIEEAHQEITDSIAYAKRIQSAILPPDGYFQERLPKSFVLYKPKDVVAGDFYWLEEKNGKILFAAADCTGHGVPGAMVSVICNNGLNRSVREVGLTDPAKILSQTRDFVLKEFEKSAEDVKDGMDIALCSLKGKNLEYAGAFNPLWIIRKGADEVEDIRANKQPIGSYELAEPFTTHQVELYEGDTIYIFSDGYADQFGGEKGKKMKGVNFKKLLLSIQDKRMSDQKVLIDEYFENWCEGYEQIDDVCVIGVRI